MMTTSTSESRNIVFVHPDLGIGGAERLVIDTAVGLQSLGHRVTILTSFRDTNHCFPEARDGSLDVRVRGDSIFPPSIGRQLSILFAILRQTSLILSVGVFSSELRTLDPDVIFVDQLSAGIPLFRLLYPKAKILFYGHYPDRLLARPTSGLHKFVADIYRIPFDAIEEWSTGCADSIVVNSKFTRSVFKQTLTQLKSRDLKVIYPCVQDKHSDWQRSKTDVARLLPDSQIFLSINRFEQKKNLHLAIKAYAGLSQVERASSKLVVAGGFDARKSEDADAYQDLVALSDQLGLSHKTFASNESSTADLRTPGTELLFLLSVPHELKMRLLYEASMLLYTPSDEHFGIVPLEAMMAGTPVLATNTGGPLETIYDGRTGWLRSPSHVEQWTDVMRKPLIPSSAAQLRDMGQRGRQRVLNEFSHAKMTQAFDTEIQRLCQSTEPRPPVVSNMFIAPIVVVFLAIVGAILAFRLTASSSSKQTSSGR